METKFNSQICTSREQSERLLALGLKKETADMHHSYYTRVSFNGSKSHFWKEETGYSEKALPAWSLHRLIELCPMSIRRMGYHYSLIYDIHRDWVVYMLYANGNNKPYNQHLQGFQNCNRYDAFIDCIEWLIKGGYFNKEYLNGTTEN